MPSTAFFGNGLAVPGATTARGGISTGGRDLRLDFFRGLALYFIFFDHIPNNILSYITPHSFAFSDAAEAFIFISGYTASLVYGRAMRQKGVLVAAAQIYRRVWQLYVAHIFIFMAMVAEVFSGGLALNDMTLSSDAGLGTLLAAPHYAIISALLLQFQPQLLDILPLYIVLLAAFPLILAALEEHPLLILVPSAGLYVLVQLLGWQVQGFPAGHPWYFNPLAWQFLFVIGAVCANVSGRGVSLISRGHRFMPVAYVVTAFGAVVNISWVLHGLLPQVPGLFLNALGSAAWDKTNLNALRLANFIALAAVVVRFTPMDSKFLRWAAAKPVILCGKYSLQLFCLGILLSVLGHLMFIALHGGPLEELAFDILGCTAMYGLARLLEWYRRANRTLQLT